MKLSTKQSLTAIGFSITALLGCGENSKSPSPRVQTKANVDYNIKVDEIYSITAGKGKITFSRLSVCSQTEFECQPVILVFDIHGKLVTTFKAADTERIKISTIDESKFLSVDKNSETQVDDQALDFATIQKNFYEFNNQALSRCRYTQGWEKMNAVNETLRPILYIHFGVKNLENQHTMFRIDTANGSIEIAESKDELKVFNVVAPFFVVNARDQQGNIRQDNSLIYLYNHHKKCTQKYKFLNLPYSEFDEDSDQQASYLVDRDNQRESRDYDFLDSLFPSIKFSEVFLSSEIGIVKADKK